ncbi:MAG: S9 family peptidase [Actinomycetaceae bacterium]|nr:S9 family peptidase [Actinomycetaceae bacterium]
MPSVASENVNEAAPTCPPQAQKKPVEHVMHGDKRSDNYAWLSMLSDGEAEKYLVAENAWTRTLTRHLDPLINTLAEETASHTLENDVSIPLLNNGWWYYRRTWKGKEHPALFRIPNTGMRPDPSAVSPHNNEQCVWDGNVLASGHEFFTASTFLPSPNAQLGALCCDYKGDEHFNLRIFDIETGAILDNSVHAITPSIAWAADGKHIFITRLNDSWRAHQVWLHPLGQTDHDRLIYQENDPRFEIFLSTSRDGRWVVVTSVSTTTTEVRLIDRENLDNEPILICPRRSGLDYSVEPAGENLFIVHNKNNENFELAITPLEPSTPEQWQTILSAEPSQRIEWVEAFDGFAAIGMRAGGHQEVRIICKDERQTPTVPARSHGWGEPYALPTDPTCGIETPRHYEWNTSEFIVIEESPILPPRYTRYDVFTGEATVIKEMPRDILDPELYAATHVEVRAQDGTHLPMTLYHRADIIPNGENPALIYGYGAYEVSNDPYYKPVLISLLERGIVLAWTHVRGGGELGRQWYENGKELKKKNSFTDLVDCARYLEETGWVASGRLALEGRSAGGLLVGASLNIAPELFRAAHAGVPFVDVLTTMSNPDLPLTAGEWEEWGNPIESAEVYNYIKSYSPVDNVRECEYPAILATTSLHDIRVSWIEPAKWVNVLRERATNDQQARPILLKADIAGGHAGVSGRYALWREQAFVYAWIIDQLR